MAMIFSLWAIFSQSAAPNDQAACILNQRSWTSASTKPCLFPYNLSANHFHLLSPLLSRLGARAIGSLPSSWPRLAGGGRLRPAAILLGSKVPPSRTRELTLLSALGDYLGTMQIVSIEHEHCVLTKSQTNPTEPFCCLVNFPESLMVAGKASTELFLSDVN